mgnify:CR=1 FL=1
MATLASNALSQVADVKESLGIDNGVTTHDNMIIRLINAASDAIENYCNRTFASATYTNEEYDGTGANYLVLRQYPITSISSLDFLTSGYDSPSWETIDSDLYSFNADGRLYYKATFTRGFQNWRVTYVAGYSATPDDVAEACVAYVVYSYKKSKSAGIKSERLGEYSVEWFAPTGSSIIKELGLDDILDAYKTPTIASF